MAPFKRYEQLSESVKMYPCWHNNQEKDFKKKKKNKTESLEINNRGTRPRKW